MATEYAVKLAALHEESAARAAADLRKRQQRYAMLADLQAQAQVSTPILAHSLSEVEAGANPRQCCMPAVLPTSPPGSDEHDESHAEAVVLGQALSLL